MNFYRLPEKTSSIKMKSETLSTATTMLSFSNSSKNPTHPLEIMKEDLISSCMQFANYAKSVTLSELVTEVERNGNGTAVKVKTNSVSDDDELSIWNQLTSQINYIKSLMSIVKLFPPEIATKTSVKLLNACHSLIKSFFEMQTALYQQNSTSFEDNVDGRQFNRSLVLQPVTGLVYECLELNFPSNKSESIKNVSLMFCVGAEFLASDAGFSLDRTDFLCALGFCDKLLKLIEAYTEDPSEDNSFIDNLMIRRIHTLLSSENGRSLVKFCCEASSRLNKEEKNSGKKKAPSFLKQIQVSLDKPISELYMIFTDYLQDSTFWKSDVGKALTPILIQTVRNDLTNSKKAIANNMNKRAAFVLKCITDEYSFNRPLFDSSIPEVAYLSFNTKDLKLYKRFWDYFFDLYDTLNETQLHIVQPVLHKLNIFNEYSEENVIVWLPILLQKMILHDNRAIVKEGLIKFLETGYKLRNKQENVYRELAKEFVSRYISILIKDHVGWVLNEPEPFLSTSVKFGHFLYDLYFDQDLPHFAAAETILVFLTDTEGKCLGPHTVYLLASALDAVMNHVDIQNRCKDLNQSTKDQFKVKVDNCMKLLAHFLSKCVTAVSKYIRNLTENHFVNALQKFTEQIQQNSPQINLESEIFLKLLSILGSLSQNTVYRNANANSALSKVIKIYNERGDIFRKLIITGSSAQFLQNNVLSSASPSVIGLFRFLILSILQSAQKEAHFVQALERIQRILKDVNKHKGNVNGSLEGLCEFYQNTLQVILKKGDNSVAEDLAAQLITEIMEKVKNSNSQERLSAEEFVSCVFHLEIFSSLSSNIDLSSIANSITSCIDRFEKEMYSSECDPFKMFIWKKFYLIILIHENYKVKVKSLLKIEQFCNDENERIENVGGGDYSDVVAAQFFAAFKKNLFAEYYRVKFQLYRVLFEDQEKEDQVNGYSYETRVEVLGSILDTIEKCRVDGVVAALGLAKSVTRQDIFSDESSNAAIYMKSLAKIGWSSVFELRKNETFWSCIQAFVEFIVCPHFLQTGDLKKYSDLILENGETIAGLVYVFAKQLVSVKFPDELVEELHAIILNVALSGVCLPKNNKLTYEMWDYWRRHEGAVVVNEDPEHFSSDCKARILVCEKIRLDISRLIADNQDQEMKCKGLGLLQFHLTSFLNLTEKESKLNRRYFGGSMTHRIRQRALQVMLVLQPYLNLEMSRILLNSLLETLSTDSPQPSVRYMAEWLIVLIIERFPHLYNILFETLDALIQRRIGYGAFFSTICLHVSKIVKTEEFYDRALKEMVMLTLNQHVTVRIYAQTVFQKMFQQAKDIKFQNGLVVKKYTPIVEPLLGALNHSSGNVCKLHENISQSFYVNKFNCKSHYCYEVIFTLLPKMSGMVTDECCLVTKGLQDLVQDPFLSGSTSNLETFYSECEKTAWHLKTVVADGRELGVEFPAETNKALVPAASVTSEELNYQKKINPWKLLTVSEEIEEYAEGSLSKKKNLNNDDGLIVVASLLENLPNLGGLCRTCEIFGVDKFVVGSLKVINDLQFQNLSVSAQNWVNILEVPIRDLKSFLSSYSAKGYSILGVEQANNSSSLKHFTFPKKAVLLLGNEKKGVPPELLHLVDQCIEIPQAGIIRSLNVHVTGGICIWQYAAQHVL